MPLPRRMFATLAALLLGASAGAGATVTAVAAPAPWRAISEATFLHPFPESSAVDGPVIAIEQDGRGFVWFIAGFRLWRWDGHDLQAARLPEGAPTSAGQEMSALAKDGKGGLWVASRRQLFRVQAGSVDLMPVALAQAPGLVMQRLVARLNGASDTLVVAGDRAVHRVDVATGRIEAIALPADTRIFALLVDRAETLWIGTGSGLFSMPLSGAGPPQQVAAPFGNARIGAVMESSDGTLWVGTTYDGAYARARGGDFVRLDLGNPKDPPWIFTIEESAPGNVWLGSFGRGIFEMDASGALLRNHRNIRILPSSLNDDNVWTLRRDRDGLMWIGTARSVSLYDPRSAHVIEIPGDLGNAKGLSKATAFALLPIGGELWVGTAGGIDRLHPERGRVGRISLAQATRGEADPVETLFDDGERGVVASTSFLTWRIRPGEAPRQIVLPGREKGAFTSAYARFDGALWMGGTDGLWRVPDAGPPENVLAGAAQRRVATLLADGDTLWIGSWLGLLRMDRGGKPERVSHPGLDAQYVTALRRAPGGDLWVGTSGAGVFIRAAQGAWRVIDESHGLPSLIVGDIRFDAAGSAWVATQRGLVTLSPGDARVTPVVTGRRAVVTPYRRSASADLGGGLLAFGGRRGLTLVDTARPVPAPAEPPMVLTRLEDGGRDMTFEFAALEFVRPEALVYRYRLRGDDEGWRRADARHRVATFTRLPPGQYTFEAQHSRDGTNWSTPPLERGFEIGAAWHEQAAVRLLALVLLALALLGLHRVRTRVLQARAHELESAVAQRTADLASANARLGEQAAELEQASLTDALTGLRNRRFLDQNIEGDLALAQRRRQERPDGRDSDHLLVMVDIDRFKLVNDRHGHAVGDVVLVEVARRLRVLFRETDYLVRWGGEEFLVLARLTDRARCDEIAERIRVAMAGEPFDVAGREKLRITVSTGIAAYPLLPAEPTAFSFQETLAFADAALYGAKAAGRNAWITVKGPGPEWTDDDARSVREEPAKVLERAELGRSGR